jgi:hypothetical protein
MKALWIAVPLAMSVACASPTPVVQSVSSVRPSTPAAPRAPPTKVKSTGVETDEPAPSCLPSPLRGVRVRSNAATATQLTTSHPPTLDISLKALPGDVRRRLARGLPMEFALSVEAFDRGGTVVSRWEQKCQVRWMLWDEVYSVATMTEQWSSTDVATTNEVVQRCLKLDGELPTNLNTDAMRFVVRVDVDWRSKWPLPALFSGNSGNPSYSDVWDSGEIRACARSDHAPGDVGAALTLSWRFRSVQTAACELGLRSGNCSSSDR